VLGPTGMRGLDRLCELAELGVRVLEIRDARVVGPEHRPVGVRNLKRRAGGEQVVW
jgi:hypothetical protein